MFLLPSAPARQKIFPQILNKIYVPSPPSGTPVAPNSPVSQKNTWYNLCAREIQKLRSPVARVPTVYKMFSVDIHTNK